MTHAGYDSILLIGFGGPTPGCCQKYEPCPGEAFCFVEGIVGTAPQQAERVKEVAQHYMELGGFSPFNDLTFQQAKALEIALKNRQIGWPVYVGMKNWSPYLHDVLIEMAHKGHRKILGIIMAPHQSVASWQKYQQTVDKALEAIAGERPTIDYLDPWYDHPGFVRAIADRIRTACQGWDHARFQQAALIFTAHAIPEAAAKSSPYIQQYKATATAVAKLLGKEFDLAYQSQPSNATVPWTKPDILDLIEAKKEAGIREVIVAPIGFLCDHVEVLYDLDLETKEVAEKLGLGFVRAGTVGDHPEFIDMLADLISKRNAHA